MLPPPSLAGVVVAVMPVAPLPPLLVPVEVAGLLFGPPPVVAP